MEYNVKAKLEGEEIEFKTDRSETILEKLLDEGYDPPYSCTGGSCATCIAKLVKGKVTMDECFALTDEEIEDNYILTCQSRPDSEEVEIDYDID